MLRLLLGYPLAVLMALCISSHPLLVLATVVTVSIHVTGSGVYIHAVGKSTDQTFCSWPRENGNCLRTINDQVCLTIGVLRSVGHVQNLFV